MADGRSGPFDTTHPAWWGFHAGATGGRSLLELIADRTLDAELAALLWLLLEARVSLVVAAEPPLAGKSTLLTALLELLPQHVRRVVLRGAAEDFAWLPEAAELGWQPDPRDAPAAAWLRIAVGLDEPRRETSPAHADDEPTYVLAAELSAHLPVYTWGVAARTAIRAIGRGYGLATTVHADSLEEVLAQLGGREVGLSDDELSLLGVVLVLRVVPGPAGAARRRVVAAHYLRPPMRDAAGHVQRLGPAVLATWDERRDGFEHFAWGIAADLAGRVGVRTGDFERERARRAEYLATQVRAGLRTVAETRAAIAGYRPGVGPVVDAQGTFDAPADRS